MMPKLFAAPGTRLALALAAAVALLTGIAYVVVVVPQGTPETEPASAIPLPAAQPGLDDPPGYFPPSQLDPRPRLLTRVEPVYPQAAPPGGGSAVIRVLIDERGKVERVVVLSSEPVDKFGVAAAAAFADAQFSPGKRDGVAAKAQLKIEMKFPSLLPPGTK